MDVAAPLSNIAYGPLVIISWWSFYSLKIQNYSQIPNTINHLSHSLTLDFQDEVTDLDSGNNSVHTFHLMSLGIYPETLRNKLPSAPLSLSSDGIIRTNTIFQSDMSGYILMDVSAQDIDGKMANASLRVRVDLWYHCRGLNKCNCYVVEKWWMAYICFVIYTINGQTVVH